MKEVSNQFLSRLFSAEMLVTFLGLVFAVGVAWASLQAEAKVTNARVDELAKKQAVIEEAVNKIKTDIEVIKVDQRHTTQAVDEIKDNLRYVRGYIERGQ